jgi:glycosyltransferase involved in cell wall biosynthesis
MLEQMDQALVEPLVAYDQRNDGCNTCRIRALGIPVLFLGTSAAQHADTATDAPRDTRARGWLRLVKQRARTWMGEDAYEVLHSLLLEWPIGVSMLGRLVHLIRETGVKLAVLNNDLQYHTVGIRGAKRAAVPCVCWKAGLGGRGPIKPMLSRFVDAYIAISDATAADQRRARLATRRLTRIYLGIPVEDYAAGARRQQLSEELSIRPEEVVVGSVSRIVEGKGHPELLAAAALVVRECPPARFLIVGDDLGDGGVRLARLKAQALATGIAERTISAGWRNDIPDVMSAIDIYCHPNTTFLEGLCISATEAMAAGRPTDVTPAGALAETTVDRGTG